MLLDADDSILRISAIIPTYSGKSLLRLLPMEFILISCGLYFALTAKGVELGMIAAILPALIAFSGVIFCEYLMLIERRALIKLEKIAQTQIEKAERVCGQSMVWIDKVTEITPELNELKRKIGTLRSLIAVLKAERDSINPWPLG
jgi:hypothetical protein